MKIRFTYHGKLTELLEKNSEELNLNATNAHEARAELVGKYPQLAQSTFQLAQSNKILSADAEITETEMDVFPPFSGG